MLILSEIASIGPHYYHLRGTVEKLQDFGNYSVFVHDHHDNLGINSLTTTSSHENTKEIYSGVCCRAVCYVRRLRISLRYYARTQG